MYVHSAQKHNIAQSSTIHSGPGLWKMLQLLIIFFEFPILSYSTHGSQPSKKCWLVEFWWKRDHCPLSSYVSCRAELKYFEPSEPQATRGGTTRLGNSTRLETSQYSGQNSKKLETRINSKISNSTRLGFSTYNSKTRRVKTSWNKGQNGLKFGAKSDKMWKKIFKKFLKINCAYLLSKLCIFGLKFKFLSCTMICSHDLQP